jgi:5'(3')-deoxyribonucleotidase
MAQIALIDLDSTITHTLHGWLKVLNLSQGKNIKISDLKTWDSLYHYFGKKESQQALFSVGFYQKHIEPIEGALDFLLELKAIGFEVKLLTATAKDPSKIEYINTHFPNIFSELMFRQDKGGVFGDIILDDHPEHVINHVRNHNSLGFLYSHEGTYQYNDVLWNNPRFFRVPNYQKILDILRKKRANGSIT